MRYILAIPTILLVLFSQTLMAMDVKPLPKDWLSIEEYQYQRARYFFLTGDYFASSKLSRELLNTSLKNKDKTILLLRLSDIKLLYTGREYPAFRSKSLFVELPDLIDLLDLIYRMGGYEESLLPGNLSNWGAAHYFEGISLLRLNRLGDSGQVLERIPEGDMFYPYARIALAQIEVMRHNLKRAEEYLMAFISHPLIREDALTERVYILLGQVLFERGLFSEAQKVFLKVPFESPFYREALIGQVWSLTKLGQCDNAIPVIERLNPMLPYDSIEQEAQIIFGYCYLKFKRFEQAIDHFQTLSNALSATEERLEQMSKDRSIRERYLFIFLGNEPTQLTDEEQHYLSLLRRDPLLSAFLDEYKSLQIQRRGFIRKREEIMEKKRYIENMIDGIEEMLKRRDRDIKGLTGLLMLVNEKMSRGKKVLSKNTTFFIDDIEEGIYELWQRVLKRKVAGDTRRLIRFVLQEWADEGIKECVNQGFVCHIVNFLSVEQAKGGTAQMDEIVRIIEMIGKDLTGMEEGGEIESKKMFSMVREKGRQRIKKGREALRKLEKMEEEVGRNIMESEKGSKESLAKLDTHMMESFIKLKYELEDFKTAIIAGLDAVAGGMEESQYLR